MTGEFAIVFVVSIRTVVTAIMHTDEVKKTDAAVLAVVLKIMRKQFGYP